MKGYGKYLSNAKEVCKLIRYHWAIENNLHYFFSRIRISDI
ncbi:hypothetical protein HMPREF1554_00935 [Porphyromonas gingivalis F0569]|nr:hypothetical protein HMPREF1554_00935 [Porphyromonas gingivalis F0569]ERJ68294.1 hypothetical protein HMPREF1553_01134 [Porphyromonas gingivalis F0568]